MASQALPLAQLLAGEMPHDIEDVFASCKLTLFPRSRARAEGELHVPGLGEPVQAHRGRLLHPRRAVRPGPVPDLRLAGPRAGRSCSSTCARGEPAPSAAGGGSRDAHRRGSTGAGTARPTAPESRDPALVDELDSFWESRPALADLHINPLAAEATDVLLRQLGPAPVDVDGQNLVDLLAPVYRVLAEQAERRALE